MKKKRACISASSILHSRLFLVLQIFDTNDCQANNSRRKTD